MQKSVNKPYLEAEETFLHFPEPGLGFWETSNGFVDIACLQNTLRKRSCHWITISNGPSFPCLVAEFVKIKSRVATNLTSP